MRSKSSAVECKVCGKTYSKNYFPKHVCKKQTFQCNFCSTEFTREHYLVKHMCEQKRRYSDRDEPYARIGFAAYQHFYTRHMGQRTPSTHKQFVTSDYYGGFIRFGKYALSINMMQPLAFVDFLLRVEVPIDRWTQPDWYARYIRELNKNETPLEAIERNFMLMKQWSIDTGYDWGDFFRQIAPPLAALWIINGRISPWLLFTASSATDLLRRFNTEQKMMVDKAIDITYWKERLARHKGDVERIRTLLAENNI